MAINISKEQQEAAEAYLKEISKHEVQEMNFVLPYDLSKKLRSLMLIENDLKFIQNAITQLVTLSKDKNPNTVILTCIWQAIAASYGKISTKSMSGFTSIEDSWFKNEPAYLLLHNELMVWRNKFVAHREDSEYEHSMAFFKVRKSSGLPESKTYEIKAMARVMPTDSEVEAFTGLFDFLLKEISAKLNVTAPRVLQNFYAQGREFLLHHLVDTNHEPIHKPKQI